MNPSKAFNSSLFSSTSNLQSATTTSLSADQTRLLWAFFALHVIGGHFFMPLLLILSLLKRNLSRNYVFHNFCITWIIYSITFCLLYVIFFQTLIYLWANRPFSLYAGQQVGPKPTWNICRTQAALVYSVPILYVFLSYSGSHLDLFPAWRVHHVH